MKKKNRILNFIKLNNKMLKPLLFLAVFSMLLIIVGIRVHDSNKLTLEVGEVAREDIRASKTIEDENAREQQKLEAEKNVVPKYRISPLIQMVANDKISNFMDSVRDIKARDDISNYTKTLELEEISNLNLDSSLYSIPINMDYRDLSSFENLVTDLLSQTMGQGIREDELDYEKNSLTQVINGLEYEDKIKSLGIAMVNELMQPNEFIDQEETQRRIDNAIESVQPVIINPNDIIVEEGSVITSNSYELIRQSGLLEGEETSYIWYVGFTILVLLSVALLVLYISRFNLNILKDNRLVVLLLVLALTIIVSLVFNIFSSYLIPVALSTIIIAILIDVKLAMLTNFLLVGFLWLVLGFEPYIVFMYILSSNLAVLIDYKAIQRYGVLLTGLLVGAINFLVLAGFQMMSPVAMVDFFKAGGLVFLNGIISGIIALGSLPIWENVFSILTPLKLLELSNPNQPLLKRLLLEAPGTYHHCIMVGNLGEAAANAIGANAFLVRTASMYHDIGKVLNPYYFKENQFDIPNPHDEMEAIESAQIIIRHVENGKKLAKSRRLPKEIIDIIEQHHGDTSVQYFYYKAKESNKDTNIEDFKYPGKKPQSKEAAIVMLADSSEAAVRSIKKPSKESIADMVSKVVNGKLSDGQLEECDITYKDIQKIINTFVATLVAISHDRIEYPEAKKGEA